MASPDAPVAGLRGRAGRHRTRRLLLRPTVVATGQAMATMASVCYLTGGAVGFLTAWLVPSEGRIASALTISLVAVLLSVLMMLVGRRMPMRSFYVLTLATVGILAFQIWSQRGKSEATAAALLLPMLSMFVYSFFNRLAGLLAEVLILATIVVAELWWSALPLPTAATLICVDLVVAAVTAWLVRAAAEAENDAQTALPNRRGFGRTLRETLGKMRLDQPLTLAVVDLEQLAAAGDGVRQGTPDDVVRLAAASWEGLIGPGTTLARYGDTSFAVLLAGSPAEMTTLLERLRSVADPADGFHAGVAARQVDDTAAALAGRAEAALFEARRAGGDRIVHAQDSADTWAELAAALAADEFRVAYQPIVDTRTGCVSGAEALVRWLRPGVGPVPPDQFIPRAEQSLFIVELDHWVLRTACREAATWPADVPAKIAVNVSGRELDQPTYFQQVVDVLAETGLPASRLVLEVTESTLEGDSPTALDTLRALRELGVRIAIDDFGTGYSSLSRLHRLPADILKIDQSFVAALTEQDQQAPVIAAITALAQALGLRTVAEGVEEHHQAALLAAYGCDETQGWLHGRPGDPAQIRSALLQQAADQQAQQALPVSGA